MRIVDRIKKRWRHQPPEPERRVLIPGQVADKDRLRPDGTFYVDVATDPTFGFSIGPEFLRTHPAGTCGGEWCVIHNPSAHHMREWPLCWRSDTGAMERMCRHEVGHPDPDHLAWARSVFPGYQGVHGCCAEFCCTPPDPQ